MKCEVQLKPWSSALEEVKCMKLWCGRGDPGGALVRGGRPKLVVKANMRGGGFPHTSCITFYRDNPLQFFLYQLLNSHLHQTHPNIPKKSPLFEGKGQRCKVFVGYFT